MERRQFLNWVSVGMLASSLPMVLAACGQSGGDESATDTGNDKPELDTSVQEDGFQAIATVDELNEGVVIDKVNDVMVFRDPDTDAFVAVNPLCTHQACTVDFDGEAKELACPCHGSKFSLDGKPTAGPAQDSLPVYEVKEEEGVVLVKLA